MTKGFVWDYFEYKLTQQGYQRYGLASFAGFVWGHQKTNQILSAKTPIPLSH